jgi:hypothetical protein
MHVNVVCRKSCHRRTTFPNRILDYPYVTQLSIQSNESNKPATSLSLSQFLSVTTQDNKTLIYHTATLAHRFKSCNHRTYWQNYEVHFTPLCVTPLGPRCETESKHVTKSCKDPPWQRHVTSRYCWRNELSWMYGVTVPRSLAASC